MKTVPYSRNLAVVSGLHAVLIALLLGLSLLPGCASPPPENSGPMQLTVEVPADIIDVSATPAPPPREEKAAEPEPTPPDKDDADAIPESVPDKQKKPDPVKIKEIRQPDKKVTKSGVKPDKKTPDKPAVADDRKLIRRPVKIVSNRRSKLTAAEIERLLAQGATAGRKSSLSDKDLKNLARSDMKFGQGDPVSREAAYFELIRQTLYRGWAQPSSIGVAGLTVRVELTFNPDGSIVSSRILNGSGNQVMDASVSRALNTVRRVPGLPADFLSSHRRISVAFELTGDG